MRGAAITGGTKGGDQLSSKGAWRVKIASTARPAHPLCPAPGCRPLPAPNLMLCQPRSRLRYQLYFRLLPCRTDVQQGELGRHSVALPMLRLHL